MRAGVGLTRNGRGVWASMLTRLHPELAGLSGCRGADQLLEANAEAYLEGQLRLLVGVERGVRVNAAAGVGWHWRIRELAKPARGLGVPSGQEETQIRAVSSSLRKRSVLICDVSWQLRHIVIWSHMVTRQRGGGRSTLDTSSAHR